MTNSNIPNYQLRGPIGTDKPFDDFMGYNYLSNNDIKLVLKGDKSVTGDVEYFVLLIDENDIVISRTPGIYNNSSINDYTEYIIYNADISNNGYELDITTEKLSPGDDIKNWNEVVKAIPLINGTTDVPFVNVGGTFDILTDMITNAGISGFDINFPKTADITWPNKLSFSRKLVFNKADNTYIQFWYNGYGGFYQIQIADSGTVYDIFDQNISQDYNVDQVVGPFSWDLSNKVLTVDDSALGFNKYLSEDDFLVFITDNIGLFVWDTGLPSTNGIVKPSSNTIGFVNGYAEIKKWGLQDVLDSGNVSNTTSVYNFSDNNMSNSIIMDVPGLGSVRTNQGAGFINHIMNFTDPDTGVIEQAVFQLNPYNNDNRLLLQNKHVDEDGNDNVSSYDIRDYAGSLQKTITSASRPSGGGNTFTNYIKFVLGPPDATGSNVTSLVSTTEVKNAIIDYLGLDGGGLFTYKGTVPTQSDLPTTGNIEWDLYKVLDTNSEFYWLGNETTQVGSWDQLDFTFDFDTVPINNSDNLVNSGVVYNSLIAKAGLSTVTQTGDVTGSFTLVDDNSAVTNNLTIGANKVVTSMIADSNITNDKIANTTIEASKLKGSATVDQVLTTTTANAAPTWVAPVKLPVIVGSYISGVNTVFIGYNFPTDAGSRNAYRVTKTGTVGPVTALFNVPDPKALCTCTIGTVNISPSEYIAVFIGTLNDSYVINMSNYWPLKPADDGTYTDWTFLGEYWMGKEVWVRDYKRTSLPSGGENIPLWFRSPKPFIVRCEGGYLGGGAAVKKSIIDDVSATWDVATPTNNAGLFVTSSQYGTDGVRWRVYACDEIPV